MSATASRPLLHTLSLRGLFRKSRLDDKPARTDGLTLIELLIVVAILATLAAIAIPGYVRYLDTTRNARTLREMRFIEKEIAIYQLNTGTYPATLADVNLNGLLDPWGNPYRYLNIDAGISPPGHYRKDRFLVPLNTDYDLYSMGKDGMSAPALTAAFSQDDILRANDGLFLGLGKDY